MLLLLLPPLLLLLAPGALAIQREMAASGTGDGGGGFVSPTPTPLPCTRLPVLNGGVSTSLGRKRCTAGLGWGGGFEFPPARRLMVNTATCPLEWSLSDGIITGSCVGPELGVFGWPNCASARLPVQFGACGGVWGR